MDDGWERRNFDGLAHDGTSDSDADGWTDRAEYEAGTSPTVADTAADLYLASHRRLELAMPGVATVDKTNVVLYCSDTASCRRAYACLDRRLAGGIVTLRRSNYRINVWSGGGARALLVSGASSRSWDLADAHQREDFRSVQGDLWVQGVSPGEAVLTLSCTLAPSAEDSIAFTVVRAVAAAARIRFDHNPAASTNDALSIRRNGASEYDLHGGEWILGGTNQPACYRAGTLAAIQARLVLSQPAGLTSAVVSAAAVNPGAALPGIRATRVAFTNGVSDPEYVTLWLDAPMPAAVRRLADVWQWHMADFNGKGSPAIPVATSGVHTVYVVLAEPAAPWTNTAAALRAPWGDVLDKACAWADGASDADDVVALLTPHAYDGFGKAYDGSSSHSYGTTCHLSAMLADSVVDCQDMSAVVQLYSAALGVGSVQTRRVRGPFALRVIKPIGRPVWINDVWNFHQFGWHAEAVNDASVMLRPPDPYVPVHDDLNGTYRDNLLFSGAWEPQVPAVYTDFD
jgi:hypothetical protein